MVCHDAALLILDQADGPFQCFQAVMDIFHLFL